MKIAYLSAADIASPRAHTIQILRMCDAFSGLGHEVMLFHRGPVADPQPCDQAVREDYGLRHAFETCAVGAGRGLARQCFAVASARAARRWEPDLIYARFLPALSYCASAGLPLIFEAHEPVQGALAGFYRHRIRGGRRLRRVVAITESLRRELAAGYFRDLPAERLVVEPDGVDLPNELQPDMAGARRALKWSSDALTAVYTGGLYAGKGLEVIIEVAAGTPQFRFVIVGGSSAEVGAWTERALASGIDNIDFIGRVAPRDVALYQQAADLLLLPNQRSVAGSSGGDIGAWTSPLKLFEYMAAARPIVASDLPVLREILDEDTATLCDPDTPQTWCEALRAYAVGRVDFEARAERAAKRVGRYSWSARAQRCVEGIPGRTLGGAEACA